SGDLTITAGMADVPSEATDTNTLTASSFSGAGATNVGVAGSFALVLPTTTTEALIGPGATLTFQDGTLTMTAANVTESSASAKAVQVGFPLNTGVGASLAIDVAFDTTRAEVRDGASLTGFIQNVSLSADGTYHAATTAEAGAAGGTAVAAAAAITIAE